MERILCIETSTEVCSVSIVEGGKVVDFAEDLSGQNHSKLLTVYIDELLTRNQLNVTDFNAVAVSKGPGSYTGLRIGTSVAKGLCYAANIPLLAICPLESMVKHLILNESDYGVTLSETDLLIPMIDARRLEVYTGSWNTKGERLSPVEAKIIDADSYHEQLENHRLFYFGNGASKCSGVLVSEKMKLVNGIFTSSKDMASIAHDYYLTGKFEDIAYFEPYYLKEFMATVSKKTIF